MNVVRSNIEFYCELYQTRKNFDPCIAWSCYLSKFMVISQPFSQLRQPNVDPKKQRLSAILAVLAIFDGLRYLACLTLHKERDFLLLHWFGAMFHCLGFGGRMLYIPASAAFFGGAVMRMVFLKHEKSGNLAFFTDMAMVSDPKRSILKGKFRTDFLKSMTINFLTCFAVEVASNISIAVIFICCLIYSLWESTTTTMIIVWSFWTPITWIKCIVVINDVYIIGSAWFTTRLFFDVQLRQLESDLISCMNKFMPAEDFYRKMDKFYREYNRITAGVQRFDKTSRLLIWVMTIASTFITSSLMYAVMILGHTLLGYFLIYIWFVVMIGSLTLLSSATSISKKGKGLYLKLNSLFIEKNMVLSFDDKALMKYLIENTGNETTPSITLFNAGGVPYNMTGFSEYVVTCVLAFLICVDFLAKVLK